MILKKITGTLDSLFSLLLLLFCVHIVCREGGREGERKHNIQLISVFFVFIFPFVFPGMHF